VNVAASADETRPDLRLTLDTAEDLALIRATFAALRPYRPDFPLVEIIRFLDRNPMIAALNASVVHRNV
jgi:spore coat polysaccharide biosynthesis protein SpsF (cytidylyltransferase family)